MSNNIWLNCSSNTGEVKGSGVATPGPGGPVPGYQTIFQFLNYSIKG